MKIFHIFRNHVAINITIFQLIDSIRESITITPFYIELTLTHNTTTKSLYFCLIIFNIKIFDGSIYYRKPYTEPVETTLQDLVVESDAFPSPEYLTIETLEIYLTSILTPPQDCSTLDANTSRSIIWASPNSKYVMWSKMFKQTKDAEGNCITTVIL